MGKMEQEKTEVWLKAEQCKKEINAVFVGEEKHTSKTSGNPMEIMVFRSDIAERTILPKKWRSVSYKIAIEEYGDDNDKWIDKPFRIVSDRFDNISVLPQEEILK